MKNLKFKLTKLVTLTLSVFFGISSYAQLAGSVDTTFSPNNAGIPFSTTGSLKSMGVEVIGNSVYYAFQTEPGYPKIRKYDFNGNEDQNWYNNQMSTWPSQFATMYFEPERDNSGNYTGEFFISGRNSYNSQVNQGVRFLNKINSDGTRDLNFVCPITSWISQCTTIYHDWEKEKLYYSYRTGYNSVVIVCCDANTGQTLQTLNVPDGNGYVRKISRIPNTNYLVVGGSFSFNLNSDNYDGIFITDESFNILPVNGVTNSENELGIYDIVFVKGTECDGTGNNLTCYVAGGISQVSGVSNFKNIARFDVDGLNWNIDSNYKPGCPGVITDICFYNCHLIATGNFASSTSSGSTTPFWSTKVTAFTVDGLVSDEFKTTNIGSGIGGVNSDGFENNWGQGSGRCLAVNPSNDGNNRWEIFVGGNFANLIKFNTNRDIIKNLNFMAKLSGFEITLDSDFTYCLDNLNSQKYQVSTFDMSNTLGCEKWEVFMSSDVPFNWSLIKTEYTHNFTDTLGTGVYYKLVRTVTECGNSMSTSYILYKELPNIQIPNAGVELRSVEPTSGFIPGLSFEKDLNSLTVYPNPSNDIVTITDGFENEFRNISIYSSIGSKVLSKSTNTNNYQLDVKELPSGVYMIVVTTDLGVQREQLVKE